MSQEKEDAIKAYVQAGLAGSEEAHKKRMQDQDEEKQKETQANLEKIKIHIQTAFALYKTDKLGIRSFLDLVIASALPGVGLGKMHEIYDDKVIEIECYQEAASDQSTGM